MLPSATYAIVTSEVQARSTVVHHPYMEAASGMASAMGTSENV